MITDKMKSIGLEFDYQLLFFKPKGIIDLTKVMDSKQAQMDVPALFSCLPSKNHPIRRERSKAKNAPGSVNWAFMDGGGRTIFTTMYDISENLDRMEEALKVIHSNNYMYYLYGTLRKTDSGWWVLKNPMYVDPSLVGTFILDYQNIKPVSGDAIKGEIRTILSSPDRYKFALHSAADAIGGQEQLRIVNAVMAKNSNGQINNLDELIQALHNPATIEQHEVAVINLELMAALKAIEDGKSHRLIHCPEQALKIKPNALSDAISAIPFNMTGEQTSISYKILNSIESEYIAKEILSADVGYGKTCVFGSVAAAVASSGHVVVIYEPNETLVNQVADGNFRKWWPNINVITVTSKSKPKNIDASSGCIIIGTTAINGFLKKHNILPKLIICDEEHKFGTEQRKIDNNEVNYIASTATCIPRTMQLGKLGAFNVHRITKCHVFKEIKTTVYDADGMNAIMNKILAVLNNGKQVLVVYPLAEQEEPLTEAEEFIAKKKKNTNTLDSERVSSEAAFQQWNTAFPNMVALVYGGMDSETKAKNIREFHSGQKKILIATTAVEVGLDIPNLYYALIVHAERHGLAGLHQLRGRVARAGGHGEFDLWVPQKSIKHDTLKRLSVMEKTMDGFVIAEHDLMLRGFGSLKIESTEQSGALRHLSVNLKVSPQRVSEAQSLVEHIEIEQKAQPIPHHQKFAGQSL